MARRFTTILRSAAAHVGIGVASSSTQDEADIPTVTSGTGAPSATTEPNGSLYMRTDGTDGDDSLYQRIAGAWVAIKGETA